MLTQVGRIFIYVGIGLVIIGAVLLLLNRIPGLNLGRLPGDLTWEKGNVRIFIPIGTMVLVSLILTILLNIFFRFFR